LYFEAETPGFSLFAISGKERTTTAPPSASASAPSATVTPSPPVTPENTASPAITQTPAPESISAGTSPEITEIAMKRVIMITVGIVLLLTVLIGYLTLKRERK
jgi:hypothetical protein